MIRHLAMQVTAQLNYFPVKGGVSKYYSPRMILNRKNLDYNKDFVVPFGAYVQGGHETNPTNNNTTRSVDAIYLKPSDNFQGGHQLMDLNSGLLINRYKVEEIPVTPTVIKAVERMAEQQGIKSLKFKNRHGVIIRDADLLAGVDYEDEDDEDDDDYVEDAEANEANEEDSDEEDNYDKITEDEISDLLKDEDEDEDEPDPDHHHEDENEDQDDNEVEAAEEEADEGSQESDDDSDGPEGEATDSDEDKEPLRRSTRQSRPVQRLNLTTKGISHAQVATTKPEVTKRVLFEEDVMGRLEECHNLIAQVHPNPDEDTEYATSKAMLIARTMSDLNTKVTIKGASFAQQYILQKGLKAFGEGGHVAASSELNQLHRRNCFTPISINELTASERKKAQEALMFLTEKRDQSIKGRMVYNGKPTREWLSREDSASPTAALESIMITAVIDAHEGRDIMTADVPNAFIQTEMPEPEKGQERVIMKITGVLVDMLVQLSPEVYGKHVVFEKGRKVLYVQVLRAIYGMLQASLLWYKKFRGDLEKKGFEFNPYDPCVANKVVESSQHTIRFHVDDLMSSHLEPKVNDEFLKWLNGKYGSLKEVTSTRGHFHDYLGMDFDFSQTGQVSIDMSKYVSNMVDDFPVKFKTTDSALTPAGESLFQEGQSKKLDRQRAEEFHTAVAKALFVAKRARPDIHPTVAVLCTRVRDPTETDWQKLIRLLKYLNGTRKKRLTMRADNLRVVKWYVDAAFAVHPDYKSHTGGTMTFGKGAVQTISRKQKLNTRSSTEAELVGADDAAVMILWTKMFMEAQGYTIEKNILYQDNKSAILLEVNGKRSSGKRTRALNVRYFFLTDQVEKKNLIIEYCPTDDMVGDYMSKPLQGQKFRKFRDEIMG